MLTKQEAANLVQYRLTKLNQDEELAIAPNIIEKPYGWVFYFNSKKFLESGDASHALYGAGPVIVNKNDGTVNFCGTSTPPSESIAQYERGLSLD